MSNFCQCPRCGGQSLEKLETYSHCAQCLYVEDYWESPDRAYIDAEKVLREFEDGPIKTEKEVRSNVIELPNESECELETMGA